MVIDMDTGSMIPPCAKLFTDPQLLGRNLREFGWSQVLVDVSVLSQLLSEEDEEHGAEDDDGRVRPSISFSPTALLRRHREWETLHEDMFDQKNFSQSVTYRRAESGSPGSLVEPKQSLELKRSDGSSGGGGAVVPPSRSPGSGTKTDETDVVVTHDDEDPVHTRMKSWITILHVVARTVAKSLEWPDDTLIANNNKTSKHVHVDSDAFPPMDLLRAFLYDAVPSTNVVSDDDDYDEVLVSLGSSPHTDWGSLTVVWQDGVGGLETYCRPHHCWVPVPAAPVRSNDDDDDNVLPLIIHIGDVTSLAMRGDSHDDDDGGRTAWPSPLHRVRSPSAGRRRSLVYFCYPSPNAGSLQNLQHLLRSSTGDHTAAEDKKLAGLEHYSLLHDQSQDGQQQQQQQRPSHARQVYARMLHKPLTEVFAEKWSQVQR